MAVEVAPSTRMGNVLGRAMLRAARLFDYSIPLAIIWAYSEIPPGRRHLWFGGPSTSAATARKIRAQGGGGWEAIRIAASNHPPHPELP